MLFDFKETFTNIKKQPGTFENLKDGEGSQSGISILDIFTLVIFAGSVIGGLALFGYNFYLNKDIQLSLEILETKRSEIEGDRLDTILQFFERAKKIEDIVYNKRINYTTILSMFGVITDPQSVLTSLSIRYEPSAGPVFVSATGKNNSIIEYLTQLRAFSGSPYDLKNKRIDDFNVTLSTQGVGDVSFIFSSEIDPETVLSNKEGRAFVEPVDTTGYF